jgi:hypothetical protein
MGSCSFWVEGRIAVFSGDPFLIERVRPHRSKREYVIVNFRSLESWHSFPDDTRLASGENEGCAEVREPTDAELARIAACRLIGDDANDLLGGFTKC